MKDRITYAAIRDAVVDGFDEYINEEHLNVCQSTAKILEEDWREVNYNLYTKSSYFLNIAIVSFKRGEIADFIFERLDNVILEQAQGNSENDNILYQKDLQLYKKLKKDNKYEVINTSFTTKSRVDYLLNLYNR